MLCREQALAWIGAVMLVTLTGLLPVQDASAQSRNDCFTLPNGIQFCPPQAVDELTQCARSIEASPTLRPAEACRAGMVRSCRDLSDREFARRYDANRPKQLYPKQAEMTRGWNRHCPTSAGYRYGAPNKQIAKKPRVENPSANDKQATAVRAAGGDGWLIERFDARNLPALKVDTACRCRDGSEPLYGFCTGPNGTYKPAC